MIWGRTDEQREAAKTKLGTEKIKFAYIPKQLKSGRWVWWEYVRCIYVANYSKYWSWREVVTAPTGRDNLIA